MRLLRNQSLITLFFYILNLSWTYSFCSIYDIRPRQSPLNEENIVSVDVFFGNGEPLEFSNKILIGVNSTKEYHLDSQDCLIFTSVDRIQNGHEHSHEGEDSQICSYNFTLPSDRTINPSIELVYVKGCDGSLPYQYYNISEFDLAQVPSVMWGYGGSEIFVSYSAAAFLTSAFLETSPFFEISRYSLRLEDNSTGEFVDFPSYVENQANLFVPGYDASEIYSSSTIDDSIKDFVGPVNAKFSFNGRHFHDIDVGEL